jgi:hypothetical protein
MAKVAFVIMSYNIVRLVLAVIFQAVTPVVPTPAILVAVPSCKTMAALVTTAMAAIPSCMTVAASATIAWQQHSFGMILGQPNAIANVSLEGTWANFLPSALYIYRGAGPIGSY